jgi:hypothetical protein
VDLIAFDVGAELDAGNEDKVRVLLSGALRFSDAFGGIVVGQRKMRTPLA